MQARYRLYRRSNRSSGTYYAQDSTTGARESLGTKSKAEAEKLLQAKNDANVQPILSRELAKVYMHAQDPQFAGRTWGDVARIIDFASKIILKASRPRSSLSCTDHLQPDVSVLINPSKM